MISWIKNIFHKRKLRKALLDVYVEARKNWELYHVIDQREIFKYFRLQAWEQLRDLERLDWSEELGRYVDALNDYNRMFKEIEDFEQWYKSRVETRTKENARILHDKKEGLREKFQGLLPVIEQAIKAIEAKFINLKIYRLTT